MEAAKAKLSAAGGVIKNGAEETVHHVKGQAAQTDASTSGVPLGTRIGAAATAAKEKVQETFSGAKKENDLDTLRS